MRGVLADQLAHKYVIPSLVGGPVRREFHCAAEDGVQTHPVCLRVLSSHKVWPSHENRESHNELIARKLPLRTAAQAMTMVNRDFPHALTAVSPERAHSLIASQMSLPTAETRHDWCDFNLAVNTKKRTAFLLKLGALRGICR